MYDTNLVLGGKEFSSRLIVGTGKYSSNDVMRQAIEESGAEIVTVAIRRVALPGSGESILDFIDPKRYTLLAEHRGLLHGGRSDPHVLPRARGRPRRDGEARGDRRPRTLFPDVQGLLEATKTLARDGFTSCPTRTTTR